MIDGNKNSFFSLIKNIFKSNRNEPKRTMYFLRETLRELPVKDITKGKDEALLFKHFFSYLRFLGDDLMLKSRFINECRDELDVISTRYMGKPIGDSGQVFSKDVYDKLLTGNGIAICKLLLCIAHENQAPLRDVPKWVSEKQLSIEFVNSTNYTRLHDELKFISFISHKLFLSLDIDDQESKFLYLLLSRAHFMDKPSELKKEVVSKVDLTYLLEKHPIDEPHYPGLDIQSAFSGDSETLFRLAWQIVLNNRLAYK